MKTKSRAKRLALVVLVALALGFIAVELYLLSPAVRVACVGWLERVGGDHSLTALVDDDDKDVRAAAIEAITRRGARAVPALVQRLDRADANGRGMVLVALEKLGPQAGGAIPVLKKLLWHDPNELVRTSAARVLLAVAPDDPTAVAEVVRVLETGDDSGRLTAAQLLGRRGRDAEVVVPALARTLSHPNATVRQEAAEGLEHFGVRARPAIPELLQALCDPASGVRKEAAEALENILGGLGEEDDFLRQFLGAALEWAKVFDKKP